MSGIDRAIALACRVHEGQVDKSDLPYILHPLRLMLKFDHESEMIAAILHDVVEDGDITLEDLSRLGFSHEVVAAVDALTRRNGEDYERFIERVSKNELATRVKVEDLKDNLNVSRLKSFGDSDAKRIKKYVIALNILIKLR